VLSSTLAGMAIGGWMSGAIFDATLSYRAAFLNGFAWNLLNMAIRGLVVAAATPRRMAGSRKADLLPRGVSLRRQRSVCRGPGRHQTPAPVLAERVGLWRAPSFAAGAPILSFAAGGANFITSRRLII
jgi:hypothetical protein